MKKRYVLICMSTIWLQLTNGYGQTTSSETSSFELGTKWTYEIVSTGFPFVHSHLTYEITGQTLWNDTLAYVLTPDGNYLQEYMHVQGDSIYYWDWTLSTFQLNFDFSATLSYSSIWEGGCYGIEPYVANISVDSIREETINGIDLSVQYLNAEGEGMEPLTAKIYEGIGNAYRLKLGLGEDCDLTWYVTRLRCFEDGDNSYNFVGFPCDSTFIITATEDLAPLADTRVYPNPSEGTLIVQAGESNVESYKLYDFSGRYLQEGKLEDARINIRQDGLYHLVLLYGNGQLSTHKIIVAK